MFASATLTIVLSRKVRKRTEQTAASASRAATGVRGSIRRLGHPVTITRRRPGGAGSAAQPR